MFSQALLACPECHSDVSFEERVFSCKSCAFSGTRKNNIISTLAASSAYFDNLHTVMTKNNERDTVFRLCYERQINLINSLLKPGMKVVDVGCGPSISYIKPEGVDLIGIEPSLSSLASNKSVDLCLHSSATNIPLANKSVDLIICLYSIHHMIGKTKAETRANVKNAFNEFNRIIKDNGQILIFEVNPWSPFYLAENLGWNLSKKILGDKFDFYFWSKKALSELGHKIFDNASVTFDSYNVGWTETFPPAFSLQWLKVPRFMYPFDVNLHHWTFNR